MYSLKSNTIVPLGPKPLAGGTVLAEPACWHSCNVCHAVVLGLEMLPSCCSSVVGDAAAWAPGPHLHSNAQALYHTKQAIHAPLFNET
jgi:hypothetical protein